MKTPIQAVHKSAAIRTLEAAQADLIAAGEPIAAMRVGAIIGALGPVGNRVSQ